MKRSVIASLAAVAIGGGMAFGQSNRQGNVLLTEDPAPPPSVIRLGPPPKPVNRPAPLQPKSDPKPQPVQKTTYNQVASPAEPLKPPVEAPKAELLPAPTITSTPTEVPAIMSSSHQERPSYETRVFEPVFPWTKCGKRHCGTVYVETPYHWMDARFLFGWFKKDRSPPLVTTGSPDAVTPGALDDPQTTVLFDGSHLHDQPYMGGYFTVGGWFDECQYYGIEGGYFVFASQDHGFLSNADGRPGTPGLFLPFFNPLRDTTVFPSQEDVFTIAGGNNASGFVSVTSRSRLQGGDGHFLYSFSRGMSFRCDAIVGVRWMGLDEDLSIETNTRFVTPAPFFNGGPLVAVDVGVRDHIGTRNDFIGADLGFKSRFVKDCWSLDLLTRVAAGGNHRTIRGDAFTGVTFPGFPTQFVFTGRFVGPANAGVFTSDTFSVVPEIGLTFGYQATNWCKLTLGYNGMYWTNVVRPGGQVDRVINPIGVPTRPEFNTGLYDPRRPGVANNETDIWLQAVTVGAQFTF